MNLYHLNKSHLINIAWLASFVFVVALTGLFSIIEWKNILTQSQFKQSNSSQPNQQKQILGIKDNTQNNPTLKIYNFSKISAVQTPFNLSFDLRTNLKVKKIASADIFYLHQEYTDDELEEAILIIEAYRDNEFKSRQNFTYSDIQFLEIAGKPARKFTQSAQKTVETQNYPGWFLKDHTVIEVKSSENSQIYYVFSLNPKFKNLIYGDFIDSLQVW